MERHEEYFLRLMEAEGPGSTSFSGRYMYWMRRYRTEEAALRALAERKDTGARAYLDIGCGSGSLFLHIVHALRQRFDVEAVGLDISEFDVTVGRRRVDFFNIGKCRFEVGDGQRLPFPDASFDVVTALEIVEHLARPQDLLREIQRVLKPGGAAVLTTPNGGPRLPVMLFRFLNALTFGALRKVFRLDVRSKTEEESRQIRSVTDPHDESTRYKHISVKGAREWRALALQEGFAVRAVRGTGGVIWGGPPLDRHRVLFALTVLLDAFLDLLWCSALWSETLVLDLRKRKDAR